MDIAEAKGLWNPTTVFCNTASFGLPPRPAWDALHAALEEWRSGATSWEHWAQTTDRARAAFARLVGVDRARVAIGATVSELVGTLVTALPAGARVIIPDVEFTSVLFPFLVQRRLDVHTVPARSLAESIDPGVAAVAFSAVQMSTGDVAHLEEIEQAARSVGAMTICDATQAVGWLPLSASRFDA